MSPCPCLTTPRGPLSERVTARSCTLLTAIACGSLALGSRSLWLKCTCSCSFLLAMLTQDYPTSFESSDPFLTHQPPNLSSDSCTMVHHMAQSKGHFTQISANKMENLAFGFLASLVDSPS